MNITTITGIEEFAELEQHWEQLVDKDEQAGIFNGWTWNWLWWQHYSHLGELHILLVKQADELVAIVPLYRTITCTLRFVRADTLRFLGSGGDTSPDDLTVITLPAARQAALIAVCDHLLNALFPARLQLTDLPEDSTFWQLLQPRLSAQRGYLGPVEKHGRRQAILPDNWNDYLCQISRNTRKQFKRRRNRLQRAGIVKFKCCESASELARASEALIALHRARWEGKGETGSFRTDSYIGFHQDLMRALLQRDELWLMTLELDDQIIGVEYAFCINRTLAFFQTGFDPAYEHLSPGHLLMTQAIETGIERGVNRIDLLKGDYPYKTSYASDVHVSVNVDYFKPGLLSRLAAISTVIKRYRFVAIGLYRRIIG